MPGFSGPEWDRDQIESEADKLAKPVSSEVNLILYGMEVTMASKKLLDKLNDAIAREIQASVQYMWQHVMIKGINSESVGGVFKKTAMTEMKHAESIAERLDYLG